MTFNRKKLQQLRNILIYIQDRNSFTSFDNQHKKQDWGKYMYKKSVQGWLKHLDFMILDVVCLWISFTLAFNMRHGSLDVLANSLYRDMM